MAINPLLRFCADQSDQRRFLHKPFYFDGHLCATDGFAMAFMPIDRVDAMEWPDCSHYIRGSVKDFMVIYKNTPESAFRPMPAFTLPGDIDVECHECRGRGEVSFHNDHNHYQATCKSCDGDGAISTNPKVSVPGFHLPVNASQLRRILTLPSLTVAESEPYFIFRFAGGFGLFYSRYI